MEIIVSPDVYNFIQDAQGVLTFLALPAFILLVAGIVGKCDEIVEAKGVDVQAFIVGYIEKGELGRFQDNPRKDAFFNLVTFFIAYEDPFTGKLRITKQSIGLNETILPDELVRQITFWTPPYKRLGNLLAPQYIEAEWFSEQDWGAFELKPQNSLLSYINPRPRRHLKHPYPIPVKVMRSWKFLPFLKIVRIESPPSS